MKAILYLMIILSSNLLYAQSVTYLRSNHNVVPKLEEFVNETKPLPAELNFAFSSDPVWIKVNLSRDDNENYLKIDYPLLKTVQIYDENFEKQGTFGSFYDSNGIFLDNRLPIAKIPAGSKTIFIMVQSNGSVQIPLSVISSDELMYDSTMESLLFGLYYGIIIVMCFYNLVLGIITRKQLYLWYVAYVFSYLCFQLSLNGFAVKFHT